MPARITEVTKEGGEKNVQQDYLAVVWECYTCKNRSSPWSVAVLSISLHLFRFLFTQTPPSHWLALSTLSMAGSWCEAKCERLCVNREGQYIPTPSVFISKPHWGGTAVIATQNFALLKKNTVSIQQNTPKLLSSKYSNNKSKTKHQHKRLRIGSNNTLRPLIHFLHGTFGKKEVHRLN